MALPIIAGIASFVLVKPHLEWKMVVCLIVNFVRRGWSANSLAAPTKLV